MSVEQVTIRRGNVRLRPLRDADAEAILDYLPDPAIQRYLDHPVRDGYEARQAFDEMLRSSRLNRVGDALCLAIERSADRHVLGHAELHWADATAGQGEMRLLLAPHFRGRRYGGDTARALLAYGFDTLGLHRIFARCGATPAAIRLLESLGMRKEAHFREHALFRGNWDEELHFAMLAREWQRPRHVTDLASRAQVA